MAVTVSASAVSPACASRSERPTAPARPRSEAQCRPGDTAALGRARGDPQRPPLSLTAGTARGTPMAGTRVGSPTGPPQGQGQRGDTPGQAHPRSPLQVPRGQGWSSGPPVAGTDLMATPMARTALGTPPWPPGQNQRRGPSRVAPRARPPAGRRVSLWISMTFSRVATALALGFCCRSDGSRGSSWGGTINTQTRHQPPQDPLRAGTGPEPLDRPWGNRGTTPRVPMHPAPRGTAGGRDGSPRGCPG